MSEFAILTPSMIAAFTASLRGDGQPDNYVRPNSITGIVSVPVSVLSGRLAPRRLQMMAILGILVMSLGGAFRSPDAGYHRLYARHRFAHYRRHRLGCDVPRWKRDHHPLCSKARSARVFRPGHHGRFLFSLIYTTVAGYLTEIRWNYSFLAYLIGLVPLVVALAWMPEAKGVVAEGRKRERAERSSATKEKIPHAIWGYALFALATWTCVVTVQIITSTILDVRGLASSGQAALVINCCGIGTILCGLAFPTLVRVFKTRLFGIGAALAAIGVVPCMLADNTIVYAIGVFVLGFGGSMFFTAAQNATGNIAPKSRVPFVSGIMTSMMNLGPFIAPYLFAATVAANPAEGNDAVFPVLIAMCAVCAVIGLLHPMRALVAKPADGALDEGAPSSAAGADEIR